MRTSRSTLLVAFAVLVGFPGGQARAGHDKHPLPSVLPLPAGFQPEGITKGDGPVLYVAGFADGGIFALDPRTATGSFLVPPQTNGRKSVGIKFQRETDRLVVAGGGTGHAYVYDADTGDSLADLVLHQPVSDTDTFINDVVLTDEAAYFTDSFRPFFYRVALSCHRVPTQNDVQEIPLTGDYQNVAGAFNANGIEVTSKGDLIIVNGGNGKLYKVDPDTGVADEIELEGGDVTNGDGLVLLGRTLYVVENFSNQIVQIKLSGRFDRGSLVRTITNPNFDTPATAALFKGALYVTNPRFGLPEHTPETTYNVVRVPID